MWGITMLLFIHLCVPDSTAPWMTASQASLNFTICQSLLRLMSFELVMPSNHFVLCHPLLYLTSIFHIIRGFSNELALHIRWPKYSSFSFSISPSNEYSKDWFPLGLTGLISFSPRDSQESSPTPQFKSINPSALSLLYGPTLLSIHGYWKNHSFD